MAVSVRLITELKSNWDTDHFHPHLARTFRLLTHETTGDEQSLRASVPVPLVAQLNANPFVEKTVIVRNGGYCNVQTDNGDISVELAYSEPTFFEVFGFKLLSGNAKSALKSPKSVLLSEQTAKKIFGNKDPLGQTLMLEDLGTFTA